MPYFASGPGGINLEDGFLRETDIIDRYVGNQLWTWGTNTNGQVGDISRTNRSSPVQTVSGGTNWTDIACNSGSNHSIAIKSDGTLWTWGLNTNGQLGDATIVHRSSPIQTVSGGTNWKIISTGWHTSAAIKTDGTLWTWGRNTDGINIIGLLGDGSSISSRSSPVQTIAGGKNWKQISMGGYCAMALKTDNTLWMWGHGTWGLLGDGTNTTHRSSPIQTISGGTNWAKISSVTTSVAAIKSDGTLWTWGLNSYGQLGDGTIVHRSSPIQTIAGGTNWKQISAGSAFGAIKTDGTLWVWGINGNGELGDGTVVRKSSPVQTISGGTNWKQITNNMTLPAAIKTDGTLWTWGYGAAGEIGNGSSLSRSSPVQTLAGGDNWKKIVSGSGHKIALTFAES